MSGRTSLAHFIEEHLDALVDEWEAFAHALQPEPRAMGPDALRDWARQMLKEMASDMASDQSASEQQAKARGERPYHAPEVNESARVHAGQRLSHGFELPEVVAEFRALRASVVRRWMKALELDDHQALKELVRFNEALDQVLTESIATIRARSSSQRRPLIRACAASSCQVRRTSVSTTVSLPRP